LKIILVAGARPNFIKLNPLYKKLLKTSNIPIIVNTGQHYDYKMSTLFFKNFNLPQPHYSFNIKDISKIEQLATISVRFERILLKEIPDLVIVFGDVDSTFITAFVASRLGIEVMHVEACLRSFDRTMPEEINRVLTDQISQYLITPSINASKNLKKENVKGKIFFAGNIMIDSLISILEKTYVIKESFILVTLHRPFNVDNHKRFNYILSILEKLHIRVFFVTHHRNKEFLKQIKLKNIELIEPLGYIDFISYQKSAQLIITDSGGVQEESTYLKIPCLTLRPNTERPETLTGTNKLTSIENLYKDIKYILENRQKIIDKAQIPEKWDGNTAKRIVRIINENVTNIC